MRASIDDLRNAMGTGDGGEGQVEGEPQPEPEPEPQGPTMNMNMGPDGTNVSVSGPLGDMSFQEAVEFAQAQQKPGMAEQVLELLQDPDGRQFLQTLLFGEGGRETQQIGPAQPAPTPQIEDNRTMDDIATPDGGQAQAQEQEPEPEQVAQPPEGMDSDLAYESTKACLESLPEDMSLEQMQYLVLVLQDSLSLVAQRDPDVTAGKAAGYMDRFESQIRTHFAQVIDA